MTTHLPILYIHIGTHKTGSTAIQHALRQAAGNQSEGWKYIPTPKAARQFMVAENYNVHLVNEFGLQIRKLIYCEVAYAKYPPRLVMSYEGLGGNPFNGYNNSKAVATMLRDATKEYNVRIIVYLRRQDEWLESLYTQRIHQGESCNFDSFKSKYISGALDYSQFLENFEICFGSASIIVRSYHEASRGGLISDFGKIINSVALAEANSDTRINPSYSPSALKIAKLSNPSLNYEQKRLLRSVLQDVLPRNAYESFGYFTEEHRNIFIKRFKASNQKVADKYFDGDAERAFFYSTISKPHHTNIDGTISCEQAARIAVKLLSVTNSLQQSSALAYLRKILLPCPRVKSVLRHLIRGKRQ